jgi:hypothetical protein
MLLIFFGKKTKGLDIFDVEFLPNNAGGENTISQKVFYWGQHLLGEKPFNSTKILFFINIH